MPVTARFIADFTQFQSAVDKADVKLRDFQSGIGRVDKDLAKFGNSFSGVKIIQDAALIAKAVEEIGGASKLTEKEQARVNATVTEALAKYRALGEEAPAALTQLATATKGAEEQTKTLSTRMIALGSAVGSFVGTFASGLLRQGITSLVSMGKAAFDSASQIVDLSNKTGLSTGAIQRMQFVAGQTGGTLEQFTQSAFLLGTRLAGGSGSVQAAVEAIGLSFQELQRQRPDQQFETVVAALGRMQDAGERNQRGVELFGKSFQNVAAAVAEGYQEISRGANESSDAQLQALDKASDRWDSFVANTKTNVTSFLGSVIGGFDSFTETIARSHVALYGTAQQLHEFNIGQRRTADILLSAAPAVESYAAQLARVREELTALSPTQRAEIAAAKELGISTDELTAKFGISEAAIARLSQARVTGAKASADAIKAMDEAGNLMLQNEQRRQTEEADLLERDRKARDFLYSEIVRMQAEALAQLDANARNYLSDELKLYQDSVRATQDALKAKDDAAQLYLQRELTLWKESEAAQDAWRVHLTELGKAWESLAQVGGKSLSELARGIGTMHSAVTMARSGVSSLQAGLKSLSSGDVLKGIAGLVSGIGGIVGAATAAYSIVSSLINKFKGGEEGTQVNPARDAWLSKFGGHFALASQLVAAGAGHGGGSLIEALNQADTMDKFASATSAIEAFLAKGVESFATGGMVGRTGLAFVHAGEKVLTPEQQRMDADAMAEAIGGRLERVLRSQQTAQLVAFKSLLLTSS